MSPFEVLFGLTLIVGAGFGFEPWATSTSNELESLYAAGKSYLVAHIPSHPWHAAVGQPAHPKSAITLATFQDYEANCAKGDLAACDNDLKLLHQIAASAVSVPTTKAGAA